MPKYCKKCTKQAFFGYAGFKPYFCTTHKEKGMIDVKHKRCQCGKSTKPVFNLSGESTAKYCATCKKDGMVDVINKRCKCGQSQPFFNLPGENTA
jgi:hypothetical protein